MSTPLQDAPHAGSLPDYYRGYLVHTEGVSAVLDALEAQADQVARRLGHVAPQLETHRYAPGKWSVRGVVGHLVDTERVFQLRALWFARGDAQALPGYDETRWGAASNADDLALDRLLAEYHAVRRSSLNLWRNFSPELLARTGEANGQRFQVGAIPWFLLGHERHHLAILKERYGV
ncbi:MAG: DinB family protein [Longimicrobiales bacterium]|nr:DinB family protein [Longimicrobiales bacterium]